MRPGFFLGDNLEVEFEEGCNMALNLYGMRLEEIFLPGEVENETGFLSRG